MLGSLAVYWEFHPSGLWDVGAAWGSLLCVDMRDLSPAAPAGVPQSEQLELFSILAAILHLGNAVIRERHRRGDSCVVGVGEASVPPP